MNRTFYFSLYMALLGGNWIVYHMALPVRIAHHIILSAFLIHWLLTRGIPDTPLLLPLSGLCLALVLSGLNAIDRRMALEYAWHWITNWLLFLWLTDYLREQSGADLFKAHFVAGAILALSCIVQWLITSERPGGVFGIINLAGAYLAALVVPAISWLAASHNPRHRKLLVGFIIMAGVAIVLNQSRGSILSLFVALTVLGFLNIKGHRFLKINLGLCLLGICATLVFGLTTQTGHNSGDLIRMNLWLAGNEMITSAPSGVGVGLFAQAYHQITKSEDRFTGAHNYYITLGAEFGGVGLMAAAAFMLVALYLLIPQQRTIQQNAVLSALCGILAHMTVDNYPAQNWSFLIALYGAYLLYEFRWLHKPIPQTVPLLAAYGLALYGLMFVQWDTAQIHYERALQFKSLAEIQQAIAIDPHNRLYALQAARLQDSSVTIKPVYALTNFARISY